MSQSWNMPPTDEDDEWNANTFNWNTPPHQQTPNPAPGGLPPTYRQNRSSCAPCLVRLLVLIAIVGGIGYYLRAELRGIYDDVRGLTTSASTSESADKPGNIALTTKLQLSTGDPIITADLNGDEQPEVLVQTWASRNGSEQQLTLLDGATGVVVWNAPLPPVEHPDYVAADDAVLAYRERNLVAIDLATGSQRWQHQLADQVITYPQPRIWFDGDQIVIHTRDNGLTVLDRQTGAELHHVLLPDTSPPTLERVGANVCATQRDSEKRDYLQCYALADATTSISLTLAADWTDQVFWWPEARPDATDIYRLHASAEPPLLERVKPDGTVLWQQPLDPAFDTIIASSLTLVHSADHVALANDNVLALTGDDGNVHLVTEPETNLYPLAIAGDLVYVSEDRQRGTPRLTLSAYNVQTGERLWQITEETGQAYVPDRDSGVVGILPNAGIAIGWEQGDDEVVRFIGTDGAQRWQMQTTPFIASTPKLVYSGRLLLIRFSEELRAVDPVSGAVVWSMQQR